MKLTIQRIEELEQTEVTVRCPTREDAQTRELLRYLERLSLTLSGEKEGRIYPVSPSELCYADCVDDKTFLYTEGDVFCSPLRLYQLEQQLPACFVRISKSTILNIDYLESVRPLMSGKLEARLQNGEKLLVSRHYVPAFRAKFGL